MGATAAIAIGGYGIKKLNDYNNGQSKKLQTNALANAQAAKDAMTPATIPPPPDFATANTAAGQAMTQAAQRRRRMTSGGVASTILTGPGGAPPVATAQKTLLGR